MPYPNELISAAANSNLWLLWLCEEPIKKNKGGYDNSQCLMQRCCDLCFASLQIDILQYQGERLPRNGKKLSVKENDNTRENSLHP